MISVMYLTGASRFKQRTHNNTNSKLTKEEAAIIKTPLNRNSARNTMYDRPVMATDNELRLVSVQLVTPERKSMEKRLTRKKSEAY